MIIPDAGEGKVGQFEVCARALMEADGCGLTVDGERVFCDDPRLADKRDGYGRSLRASKCGCKEYTHAVLTALRTPDAGMVDAMAKILRMFNMDRDFTDETAKEVFTAAIDSLIEEAGE